MKEPSMSYSRIYLVDLRRPRPVVEAAASDLRFVFAGAALDSRLAFVAAAVTALVTFFLRSAGDAAAFFTGVAYKSILAEWGTTSVNSLWQQ